MKSLSNIKVEETNTFFGDIGDILGEEAMTSEDTEAMHEMAKMSFKEWKKLVVKNDPEMAEMSDEELKQAFNMMKLFAGKQ